MTGAVRKGRITGRHVLAALLCFFGVTIAVNGIFLYHAVQSFTGEDVPKSYRQGIEYNQKIAARRAGAALGWTVNANHMRVAEQTRIVLVMTDETGERLTGLRVSGRLRHPTDKQFDQVVSFVPDGPGRYIAEADLTPASWQLQAVAHRGEHEALEFVHTIWLKPDA